MLQLGAPDDLIPINQGRRLIRNTAAIGGGVLGVLLFVLWLNLIPVASLSGSSGAIILVGAIGLWAMGASGWFAMNWAIHRTSADITLGAEGLRVVQMNGKSVDLAWSDADLALRVTEIPPGTSLVPGVELQWRGGGRSGVGRLSPGGLALLREAARLHGLEERIEHTRDDALGCRVTRFTRAGARP